MATGAAQAPAGRSNAAWRGAWRLRQVLGALGGGVAICCAAQAVALSLSLPSGADRTASDSLPSGIQLPIGISREGEVPRADFAGHVRREAFFVPSAAGTLDLTAPLKTQLEASGWTLLVDCAAAACGGFDFRFALEVLPEPAMHVDLGDFRYLAAEKADERIAILASKRGAAGYLQITHAAADPDESVPRGAPLPDETEAETGKATVFDPAAEPPAESGEAVAGKLAETLEGLGHVVLGDLVFATGSSELGAGPFASLEELAAYLLAHPARRLALVGHTDATGGLDVNVSVSRRRAQSVLETLVRQHKVPRSQLVAQGVGFLAPLRSNLADEGRAANRRVEAVLISVD